MTETTQIPHAGQRDELLITTNRGGNRVFSCLNAVREFAVATSEDLALLTAVIDDSRLDPAFVMQTHGLLNDLAFQLQQAVALMCEADGAPANHKPSNRSVDHG